ncbi:hypothetical protein [Pseudovibrio sp. Tun.PSC04-5.I4]|uniref:hypothetical protein n=1 Tax=Pseudovibrio sp. Tun.PSC04-5.I4 TaxID=1798213 RepID=UPI000882C413|nr:hypothetical protein [Pseudovibrio sp. Tun.PSC04-5.I4]SDR15949.1 hypothetical protein SAMN04515695_3085 [Pseudovibrio sp. Tun.PSC04-5.I4]SDR40355.1 hypothetical protein SAMN04515695_5420 [Pseudovibrio sp. Tun.PSC04-5.I4]
MQINVHDLIEEQVATLGSKKAVADAMGVSRTAVSLYLAGRLTDNGGRVDRFERRAVERFCDRIMCPHLGKDISFEDCQKYSCRSVPQSDPAALRHWAACQRCSLNTSRTGQDAAC